MNFLLTFQGRKKDVTISDMKPEFMIRLFLQIMSAFLKNNL